MNLYSLSLIFPLFLVNFWHGYLLMTNKSPERPGSISEHACANSRHLVLHKNFHILISVFLIGYAVGYLFAELGLTLLAALLVLGATMDIIEVSTLNKNTPTSPDVKDIHQITAWIMAISYVLFALGLAFHAGLPFMIVNATWISFVLLVIWSLKINFKSFWAFQMAYFFVLSIIILIAHFSL